MTRTCWMLSLIGSLLGGGQALADAGQTIEIDGLKSSVPAAWKPVETDGKMRVLQYRIPRAAGDKADAEFIVFYFGPGGGGGVAENIKRWKGMFLAPEGKSIDDVSKVDKFKVGDVEITYLDVHGTFKYKRAPFIPDEQAELRPDHRMLAVVFDSPRGPYFLRFVGPANTVGQNKKAFDEMLKGFK